MSTYEILHKEQTFTLKKKIALLGGFEKYKDIFQEFISSSCLEIENKQNIGVNISKIDKLYKDEPKIEYLLWNIDCGQRRACLRNIFYSGSEAVIIFISESKLDQIPQYFNEIQTQLQNVNILFCVILENSKKNTLLNNYFKNEELNSLIENYKFQINSIDKPISIIHQISSNFLDKMEHREVNNVYIIDFIQKSSLLPKLYITDECNDYFEPQSNDSKVKQIINTEKLVKFILKLDFDVELDHFNWVKVRNKIFGTFSIFIKDGNVYYSPIICENCKNRKCSNKKDSPYFICIEADSKSWTNIEEFKQPELLFISKVIALKEGNENTLPSSILKQILNRNQCKKKR